MASEAQEAAVSRDVLVYLGNGARMYAFECDKPVPVGAPVEVFARNRWARTEVAAHGTGGFEGKRAAAREAARYPEGDGQFVKLTDVHSGESWVIDARPDPIMRDDGWRTRDGHDIPIGEMETQHIERVIRNLRLRPRGLHERAVQRMIGYSAGPFAPGGDMASMAFDHEFGELIEAEPAEWLEGTPIMRALKGELLGRFEPWLVDHDEREYRARRAEAVARARWEDDRAFRAQWRGSGAMAAVFGV